MTPQIEYSSGARFSVDDRLARADAWYAQRGLPSIAERRNRRGGLTTARRVPSKPTPPKAPARIGPVVIIVAAPGDGRDQRGAAEGFGRAAWRVEDLNTEGHFGLERFGHNSDVIERTGPHLRASLDDVGGLIIEWRPDFKDPRHKNIVSDIEAGHDGVSLTFKRGAELHLPGIHEERRTLIVEADLVSVALLRQSGQQPLYPGALAYVSFAKDQTGLARDRRRAIDKALGRARAARG